MRGELSCQVTNSHPKPTSEWSIMLAWAVLAHGVQSCSSDRGAQALNTFAKGAAGGGTTSFG